MISFQKKQKVLCLNKISSLEEKNEQQCFCFINKIIKLCCSKLDAESFENAFIGDIKHKIVKLGKKFHNCDIYIDDLK